MKRFLAEHPQVRFHFTPTYSSWLIEFIIVAKIQRDVIRRSVFIPSPPWKTNYAAIVYPNLPSDSAGPIPIHPAASLLIESPDNILVACREETISINWVSNRVNALHCGAACVDLGGTRGDEEMSRSRTLPADVFAARLILLLAEGLPYRTIEENWSPQRRRSHAGGRVLRKGAWPGFWR